MTRLLIAAALALTTIATPAFAATSEKFQMEVEFSRAKLATPAGAAAEYKQISQQVTDRCEAEHEDMNYGKQFAVKFCTERTLAKAVRRISEPNLTAVHSAQN
jgi:UrcA family protein